jgi:hypothetical protein
MVDGREIAAKRLSKTSGQGTGKVDGNTPTPESCKTSWLLYSTR